jgi:hypothetical protein
MQLNLATFSKPIEAQGSQGPSFEVTYKKIPMVVDHSIGAFQKALTRGVIETSI